METLFLQMYYLERLFARKGARAQFFICALAPLRAFLAVNQ